MIKALRVVLIVWAAIAILIGLVFIFFPSQLGSMMGYEKGSAYILYLLELLGVSHIAPCVFLIIAARDPLKNIMWVQLAITWAILVAVVAAYSIMRGFVTFGQEGTALIINAVFAVALLALYPWRAKSS